MKRILLDNALESWISAISYANAIVSGKATLKYRKSFVASLHNTTELFIKQHMLNVSDHSVCKKLTPNKDPDGSLQEAFNRAIDLNEFFEKLQPIDFDKFYSESYNELCKKTDSLFASYYMEHPENQIKVTVALDILKRLRNNETHFFIEKWNFLSDSEFEELYNFMIVFYDILQEYNLLPFWGAPSGRYENLDFDKPQLMSFSYKDALLKSNVLREIAEVSNGIQLPCINNSAYTIAREIADFCDQSNWKDRFDDLWTYVETAMYFDLISIDEIVDEYDDPDIGQGENLYCYLNVSY